MLDPDSHFYFFEVISKNNAKILYPGLDDGDKPRPQSAPRSHSLRAALNPTRNSMNPLQSP